MTHGFSKDTGHHSADIRVVHKNDRIVLRIRDNCKAFNPTEYAKMMEMDAMGKNMGISLVCRIAKDISYQNLLGMNVLTIRV